MPLEITVDRIPDLNPEWPLNGDVVSDGAAHLRNIKTALTADNAMMVGSVLMWHGALVDIPAGWALCDGANGTPDLRDRFVICTGPNHAQNSTGGANSITLTEGQVPVHTHTASSAGAGGHNHGGATGSDGGHSHTTGSAGSHSHSGSANSAGNHSHSATTRNVSGTSATSFAFASGASNSHSTNSAGAHTHSLSINSNGSHSHSVSTVSDHSHTISAESNHSHTITVDSTGNGDAIDNQPAFYALYFIKKIAA